MYIFPNPTKGAFTIDLGQVYESTQITLRDVIGRVVSTSKHQSTSIIQHTLDEPTGIYFIEIATGDRKTNIKMIIE